MLKTLRQINNQIKRGVGEWTKKYSFGIFIFNLILILLLLLRSAGYFHPFFLLQISVIFFISMILSVFFLGANSKTLFIVSIIFWTLSLFFEYYSISVWAKRSADYAYQSFFLGALLLLIENLRIIEKSND